MMPLPVLSLPELLDTYIYVFDFDAYCGLRPDAEIRPRKTFAIDRGNPDNEGFVREELGRLVQGILREPQGILRYPYTVPGGT